MKIVKLLGSGLIYFCVATILAQLVIVAMLWWKGAFGDDRAIAMFAALHGIHPSQPQANGAAESDGIGGGAEQPSLTEIASRRMLASLDLDLRETTIDKSLVDLRTLEAEIKTESERLRYLEEGMEARLARAENTVMESSLQELQRTLEAISPKQAKEQILKILEDTPDGEDTRAMNDVVRILKAMPLDRRKKILGEFKTPQETQKLADILREIRLSPVEMKMLRESRQELEPETQPQAGSP